MITFIFSVLGLYSSGYVIKHLLSFEKSPKASSSSDNNNQRMQTDRHVERTSNIITRRYDDDIERAINISEITEETTEEITEEYSRGSFEYLISPVLSKLKIFPHKIEIKSGQKVKFNLVGFDQNNEQISIENEVTWKVTAGKIDSTGLFSIDSSNNVLVTVTAQIGAIKATSVVKVKSESVYNQIAVAQLKTLKVTPDCICLEPEEQQVFKALGFDRYENPIDCGEIIWSATGGTIDENGKLIVFDDAKGIY